MSWSFFEEFAGAGGFTQGVGTVPGVEPRWAGNHDKICIDSHQANFPDVEHFNDDIRRLDLSTVVACDLFHASPCCPPFCNSRGEKQYFDSDTQTVLFENEFGAVGAKPEVRRGRLLMHEVPKYLQACADRGRPVIAGSVENVVEARLWGSWDAWINRIRSIGPGYEVALIAVNSMHLKPVKTRRPPQSRDRLLVLYWLKTLGRRPDLHKWMLRPQAWCTGCDTQISAMQVFKDPGQDMGRYGRHGQYYYRCPNQSCRNTIVEPDVPGAIEAVDWTVPATRISERVNAKGNPDPLQPTTMARIEAGIRDLWGPMVIPSGGTWRKDPVSAYAPMPARTTRETDGWAIPPDFAMIMRNNTSRGDPGYLCTPVTEPMRTLTTAGHQSVVWWDMIVPYYSKGRAQGLDHPLGTLSTRDRYALASADRTPVRAEDMFYRMFTPLEVGRGMGYADDYIVLGTGKQQIRQYGQSCTPCLGELSYSALIEAISGESLGDGPWAGYVARRREPAPEPPAKRRRRASRDQDALFEMSK